VSGRQTAQHQTRQLGRRDIGGIEVVLQEERVHIRPHHQIDRHGSFVQRCFAFEVTALPTLLEYVLQQLLHARLIGMHRLPAPRGRGRGNVIQLAIAKKQPKARLGCHFEHPPQLFGRLLGLLDGRTNLAFDLVQAVGANHLADGLLGLEELVDVRLGESDGLGEIGDRRFLVAVSAEMLGGGRHDLIAHLVVGWAAGRHRISRCCFHRLKVTAARSCRQQVTIWYYGHHSHPMSHAMQPKNLFSVLIAAGLLTSCAVGPDYVQPDVPMPKRFQGQAAVDQRHASVSADLATWWAGFGDPQLARFVALALEQNLDLAQAAARVAQARAGLRAANAALLPSGNITGHAARMYQSVETPLGRVLNSTPNFDRYGNDYEADFNASWELDLFGGRRREREAALAEYQASEAGAVATRLAVAAQTADIYISIRGLQARLQVARNQVRTQQHLLSTIQLLYSKGLAADLQVGQAEGALAQVQASVPVLEAGLEAAMNALDVMLGAQPGTHRSELVDAGNVPVAPRISATGSPSELLRRRPDLIVAERHLAASNARIGAAIAEYYPKVSLSGLIGSATSVASGNLFTSGANQAAGVAGLRWRLFDFGRINAQIEQAKGQQAEALAAYRLAALHATEDVENAFSALVKREEQAAVLAQGVDSLTRARTASFAAYQKGVVSLIEVLQADENLLRASDERVQAQTESARAAVAAFKSLGGGWQPQGSEAIAVK
jgi:NodT family efflux transporter outer membrane factor (OMF) lipoprotein